MAERPLLIFPNPEPVSKPKGHGWGSSPPRPTNQLGQAERIAKQFEQIQTAFVTDEPGDIDRVLVMETSNRIEDLRNAVEEIPGLEWLTEMDVDDIELHDLYDEETGKKIKGGRFYILSSNKAATDKLLGLWDRYKKGRKLQHGLGRFDNIFSHLLTLRRWGIEDRLRDTGILEVWKEEYKSKKNTASNMTFEIVLHYSRANDQIYREQEIEKKIVSAGGEIKKIICMDDIAFHAMKATLPVGSIEQVITHDWDTTGSSNNFLPVFNSEAVFYFRPTGQHIDADEGLPERPLQTELTPANDEPPVLALLDGAPMMRHNTLDDRIVLSDPDNYTGEYAEASQQKHGTAMASLICHGDLNRPQSEWASLARRIYVRPVMKPNPLNNHEEIPAEIFQEDIVERAVMEMFEGDDPTAPGVRVINLSLGNINQIYLNKMSPWAQLLDWLSFKYKVLFVVSAGNYLDPIQKDNSNDQVALNDKQKTLSGIDKNQRNHRLLSPADSMNALTVGALQSDASGNLAIPASHFDPIDDMNLPAPYSRVGPGYRSSIKPEIFAPGGRLMYTQDRENIDSIVPNTASNEPPGIQVAYPGTMPEHLNNTNHESGTSHATAIVSHGAGHIFEMLEEIRSNHNNSLTPDFDAVLIKTLLVHSASRGENSATYEHLKNPTNKSRIKRYLSRYLGYGNVNIERVLECTRTRVTAVGYGPILKEERHRFIFPLPVNSSIQDHIRLTVTLAWFSPINPYHIGLRRAKLFFESLELKGAHGHIRQESDWQQVRKGTVQHEIFELDKNNLPGNSLDLFVECAADAGNLDDKIPYGLAVTLEIAEQETIDLYQVVRQEIRQRVASKAGP